MPTYYDESTKTWFCKFYYTDYTGAKKQKKERGFKLQREAREWKRAFLERLQGTPDMTFQALEEMSALTLADFDFEANTINVNKTLYRKQTGAPKTDNGIRIVTMPTAIMHEITEYTEKIYGIQPADRVFTFSKESLRRSMIRYSEISGVPRICIHDIRHSHVSLLIDMGFTPT